MKGTGLIRSRWKQKGPDQNVGRAERVLLAGRENANFLLGCSDHRVEWSEGALSTVSPNSNKQSLGGYLVTMPCKIMY